MAIIFSEQKKRQRHLILVFIIVVLAAVAIFLVGVFQKPQKPGESVIPLPLKITEMNFKILESLIFSELEPFEETAPFEGIVGRDNPFLPFVESK